MGRSPRLALCLWSTVQQAPACIKQLVTVRPPFRLVQGLGSNPDRCQCSVHTDAHNCVYRLPACIAAGRPMAFDPAQSKLPSCRAALDTGTDLVEVEKWTPTVPPHQGEVATGNALMRRATQACADQLIEAVPFAPLQCGWATGRSGFGLPGAERSPARSTRYSWCARRRDVEAT